MQPTFAAAAGDAGEALAAGVGSGAEAGAELPRMAEGAVSQTELGGRAVAGRLAVPRAGNNSAAGADRLALPSAGNISAAGAGRLTLPRAGKDSAAGASVACAAVRRLDASQTERGVRAAGGRLMEPRAGNRSAARAS